MGTSQSFKSGPNWSTAKRAITQLVKTQDNTDINTAACNNYMSAFGQAVGDRVHSSRGGNGFGRAGSRIGKSFANFLSNAQGRGLSDVLILTAEELGQQSKFDILDQIRKHIVVGDDDATMDDDAAKVALDFVMNEIFKNCNDGKEVSDILANATPDQLDEWIIQYFADYIVEYSAELFQTHIFDKGGDARKICNDIRGYLEIQLEQKFMDKLRGMDLRSQEGQRFLDDMTKEILNIWEH